MRIISTISSLFSISDEQAMWRIQSAGDHQAFAKLVERWQGPILDLCTRMTGDPHLGEDLKQTTFARVFEKRSQYRPTARFSTYLWRIALNLCYDELRRVKRRGELPINESDVDADELTPRLVVSDPGPDMQAASEEEGELVRQALLQLPDTYRTVLVLRHYENLKLREIAEVLEIPEGTVNSRMAEALARMARLLEPHFGAANETALLQSKQMDPKPCTIV